MSEAKRKEFYDLVKAAHGAIDEFAEGRERDDWFPRDLDGRAREAVERLTRWGIVQTESKQPLGLFAVFYDNEARPVAGFVLEQDAERYAKEYAGGGSWEVRRVDVYERTIRHQTVNWQQLDAE